MTEDKKRSGAVSEAFHKAAPFLNIVYVLFGAVALFAYLGNLIDHKWDTSPLGITGGALLGFALGMYNMIKVIQDMERR